ncbi:MAG: hypothetical protein LWW86_14420 [Micrococcales bacterium]|nr:hypothetical protein [Micrococcales bacterium]
MSRKCQTTTTDRTRTGIVLGDAAPAAPETVGQRLAIAYFPLAGLTTALSAMAGLHVGMVAIILFAIVPMVARVLGVGLGSCARSNGPQDAPVR